MSIKERHESLKKHLKNENPILLDIVQKYEILDNIGYKTGFLQEEDSYTGNISWWPIISVLGTFSAGKSSFINNYMGVKIQTSGNQAVDDKFTAICYGSGENVRTLPGIALDSDPRFPFYGISDEIEKIEQGEGNKINLYMQLKSANSDNLKGRIFIDSPGFDADEQRDTILRMTQHIIDISDLVLVFFDARHPEPGAMRDTLEYLVKSTMNHPDADKILYILNQIDTTSKEDNLEDIISSWQRALAQKGLITGNFYTIYNEASSDVIEDEAIAQRLKSKKDAHMAGIEEKIEAVGIQRAYRIATLLTNTAKDFTEKKFPKLRKALDIWSQKVIMVDMILLVLSGAGIFTAKTLNLLSFEMPLAALLGGGLFLVLAYLHFGVRKFVAKLEIKKYAEEDPDLARALEISTRWYKPLLAHKFATWNMLNLKKLNNLVKDAKTTIQKLNDKYIIQDDDEKQEQE
ncbi:MAG: dynamin family protein [Epsilonproteobacteria bacterium]|nr:dynamin family protein [Campylobacterota bacterium]